MSELLFEIGTEELPAGYIQLALDFIASAASERFNELALHFTKIRTVGTPRRLTLVVDDLQSSQEDSYQEHIGPPAKAGFDTNGKPTKAAVGFARSKGLDVEELKIVETAKGEYLMAVEKIRGRKTIELLPDLLTGLIKSIVFPKSMRWADGSLSFARPIQWLLAVYDGELIDFSVETVRSGNVTCGHRFMAPDFFLVSDYKQYYEQLKNKFVLVDHIERRQIVISEVRKAVDDLKNWVDAEPVFDEGLIDTVTNLVESPWGVCGKFAEKYLELPDDVLITSMREHQKYFPVRSKGTNLLPLFVAVNNTRIEDRELAANGHERVLRARLEDALFFFREDRKRKLSTRQNDLSGIIFQSKLGNMLEKSRRIEQLVSELAEIFIPEKKQEAIRAAQLAKNDLLTEMVGEFPSLQGVMGREYALLDGESKDVALAIYEHYLPLRAGSELPESMLGAIVGLADRIDTIVGCFAINERPSGTADPFGLRRQCLGIINILQGLNISLSLRFLIEKALTGYLGRVDAEKDTSSQTLEFIRLRFENDCIAKGIGTAIVTAATSVSFDDVVEVRARIDALSELYKREEFTLLSGSFKRIKNIIKENKEIDIDISLFSHQSEEKLYATFIDVRGRVLPLIEKKKYQEALETILLIKEPLDRFFDDVMVMVDDPAVQQNRLNLLTGLGNLVLLIGDISRMHKE